jgi:P pilus assembly chaperone PapD
MAMGGKPLARLGDTKNHVLEAKNPTPYHVTFSHLEGEAGI